MMEYQTTLSQQVPIALTIGNFDGIHLGHQHLMDELVAMARDLHCQPVMVTFDPHTVMVVRPDVQAQFLTTLTEKLMLAHTYGHVANTIVIKFNRAVAALSAQDFMQSLCERFTIRGLLVGENFSLGHNRMGDIAFLRAFGQEHGIEVRSVALEEVQQTYISSTRIRKLVSAGNLSEANALLGHPLLVSGNVVHGDERGRLLGFPTANLRPAAQKLIPANGVYAARVRILDLDQFGAVSDSQQNSTVYNGVVNIGVRPTFNGKERLVEVHLLDVNLDLYDKFLSVELIEHLRGEQRFSGVDALKTQIASDVQNARLILASRRVDH